MRRKSPVRNRFDLIEPTLADIVGANYELRTADEQAEIEKRVAKYTSQMASQKKIKYKKRLENPAGSEKENLKKVNNSEF